MHVHIKRVHLQVERVDSMILTLNLIKLPCNHFHHTESHDMVALLHKFPCNHINLYLIVTFMFT